MAAITKRGRKGMGMGSDASKPHETYRVAPSRQLLPGEIWRDYADISLVVVEDPGACRVHLHEHRERPWSELREDVPVHLSPHGLHVLDALARDYRLDVAGMVQVIDTWVAQAGLDVKQCRPASRVIADTRAAALARVSPLLEDLDADILAKLQKLSRSALLHGLDNGLEDTGVGGQVGGAYRLLLSYLGSTSGSLGVLAKALKREQQRRQTPRS